MNSSSLLFPGFGFNNSTSKLIYISSILNFRDMLAHEGGCLLRTHRRENLKSYMLAHVNKEKVCGASSTNTQPLQHFILNFI
jgi:hypothetical protein